MRSLWTVFVGWMLCSSALAQQLTTSSLFIREVVVSGDLIPQPVLDRELSRYRNRNTTANELLQLAQTLTEYLIEQGYVNSGVVLPDQKIENGVVRLEIVVGRLDRITVNGRHHVSSRRIDAVLGDLEDGAFNINTAVQRLQLLEREPLIRRLNAELKPSVERGHAMLDVDIEEQRAYGGSIGVDNNVSPNIGGQELSIDAYHRSVLGWQDSLFANYRNAEGYAGGGVEYRVPLIAGTAAALRYSADSSRIVTPAFEALDIRGESQRYGVGVRANLIDNLATQFALELGVQKEQVQSFLAGEPFSFSSADAEGRSTVVMAQFNQEWVRHGTARVLAIRSNINVGLAVWDATVGGNADGEFVEWLGQGEWIERVPWRDGTIGLRLQAHLANDELPAFRKYSLGGVHSVRGYRESVAMRDNGVVASLEWKTILARWPVHWLNFGASRGADGQLSLAPFIDYGRGWNKFDDQGPAVSLAGAGAALRWAPANNTTLELQYGRALSHYESGAVDHVLADDGIYFNVRVGF